MTDEKEIETAEELIRLFRIFQLTDSNNNPNTGIPEWNYADLSKAIISEGYRCCCCKKAQEPKQLPEPYRCCSEMMKCQACGEAHYCKQSPLNKHDLIQFLTGWGINYAHKLGSAICERFGANDQSKLVEALKDTVSLLKQYKIKEVDNGIIMKAEQALKEHGENLTPCQCRDGQSGTMTVLRLSDGRCKCPRCGGIVELKENQ